MIFDPKILIQLRKENRWTVRAMAEKLGITATTLHMWESGHHKPPKEKIIKIAELLNIPIAQLLQSKTKMEHTNFIDPKETNFLNIISEYKRSKLGSSIESIDSNMRFLVDKVKEFSLVFNAIIHSISAFCYIKDCYQNYIVVSDLFLKMLNLPKNYKVKGKKDNDFFPTQEAKENTEEDRLIMETGNCLHQKEGFIPGMRKRRHAIICKTPILGAGGMPIGVMGIFFDITKRKKAEQLVSIFRDALETMEETIWIAKSAKSAKDGGVEFSDIQYIVNSRLKGKITKHYNIDSLPYDEQAKYIRNNIILNKDSREKYDLKKIIKGKQSMLRYDIINPENNEIIHMKEKLYYSQKLGLFIAIDQIVGSSPE